MKNLLLRPIYFMLNNIFQQIIAHSILDITKYSNKKIAL